MNSVSLITGWGTGPAPVRVLPLHGIRVLELTHTWAGPRCGMTLGDMGVEAIKGEAPTHSPEARRPAPLIGVDAEAVLRSIDRFEDERAKLRDEKVIA